MVSLRSLLKLTGIRVSITYQTGIKWASLFVKWASHDLNTRAEPQKGVTQARWRSLLWATKHRSGHYAADQLRDGIRNKGVRKELVAEEQPLVGLHQEHTGIP